MRILSVTTRNITPVTNQNLYNKKAMQGTETTGTVGAVKISGMNAAEATSRIAFKGYAEEKGKG